MKLAILPLMICMLASPCGLFAQTTAIRDNLNARLEKTERLLSSQPDSALKLANATLALAQQHGYKSGQARIFKMLARLYATQGNYTAALKANHEALTLFQELDDPREICRQYIAQGIIYRYLTLIDKSIAANLKAAEYARKYSFKDLQAAIYGNLGNVYFDKKDYDQALKYHLQSLEIDTELQNKQGMGNTYHNLAMIYQIQKQYGKALEFCEKSLAIDLKTNDQQNIALSYAEFTNIYMETGDFRKALQTATKGLSVAQSIQSARLQQHILADLPLIHAALGNPVKALAYQKQYEHLNDSLHSADLSQQIAEMQARFQSEQKDSEIKMQNLRLAVQQTSIRQKDTFITGLMAFLLTGGLIGFLLLNRYKLKQRNLKLLQDNEQFRLAQDLQFRQNIDETIHYFANSLYGKNTVEEILWDVAKNCIARLGFVDCVIYLLDEEQNALIQKAAFGMKNPEDYTILSPIVIPVGRGIVGSVALTGQPELIADTSLDQRYLMDDKVRYSELAVPLLLNNQVIGIIDSEHPKKGFFKKHHLEALQTIAAICSSKIAKAMADEEARKTRLLRLEADHIKKLDKVKSQFFANISHEFRTPLHLILAPLQKKEISVPERHMMERHAQRLLHLVNQMLDLAKAEVGMLTLDLKPGNIIYFLEHTAHSFKALALNKNIQYTFTIPEQEQFAFFDPDKLEKIVYNLLSNAIKFTPAGGVVHLKVSIEPENSLRLFVSDSGPGVPTHLQTKIFDRFYQVDSSQTRAFEGTGIGLSLTKELVDLWKGTIRVNSQEGQGSTFVVELPLHLEEADIQHLPPAEPKISTIRIDAVPAGEPTELVPTKGNTPRKEAKPSILLVEDHTELRTYVQQQLAENFEVVSAENGEEGLRIACKIIPDLIITDIMMPIMDGVMVTQHLKENTLTSHIPIIMLTAKNNGESRIEGFEKGAEQYLVKPFVFGELLARINSLLAQRNRLQLKYSREVVLQPTATTIPDREAAFLEQAIRIIEEHILNEDFSVEMLQKEIGMSRMQLHRKLKALTDQSASDFIRFIRLKRAADLLQQPGLQIAEAAYMAGFSHLSYFSKCFKAQFGVLPSEYVNRKE